MKKLVRPKSRAGTFVVLAILVFGLIGSGVAVADKYDQAIQKLKKQNAASQKQADIFTEQANSYQEAVNKLQGQINGLEKIIAETQHRQNLVRAQIKQAEKDIEHNRKLLGESIRTIYQEGQITPLEILASSTDLSEFVNQQQYQITIQDKVKTTYDKIMSLKVTLEQQQRKLARLIQDTKIEEGTKAAAQSKQKQLLAYSAGQRDAFNAQIQARNDKIASLRAQQAAAYAAATGYNGNSATGSSIVFSNNFQQSCGGGGYRYCYASLDQWVDDAWGLHYARECVHYVANALDNRGYYIPYGFFAGQGNAFQWVGATTAAGVASLVSNPQKDDVVYMPIGSLGHVAIVDAVLDSNTLLVSQMNWYPGEYSTMHLTKTSNLQYLRFHK